MSILQLRQQQPAPARDMMALQQLARARSGEKRRELMSQLADILTEDVESNSDESEAILGETLVILLDQVGEDGRAELADRVAPVGFTPHNLVKKLASDESVRVAEPVLEQSPVLTNEDLIEIASRQSEGHLLAMSRRSQLNSQVTDAIIELGTESVCESITSNSGAQISPSGFVRLSEMASASEGVAAALSQRLDIPAEVTEKVIAKLPLKHQISLEALWAADGSGRQEFLEAASEQVGSARLSKRRGVLQAKVAVKEILSGTRSINKTIYDFAGSNLLNETAYVIGAVAKLPDKYVKAALLKQDGASIALVCSSINMDDRAFEEVTRMRGSQLGLDASEGHQPRPPHRNAPRTDR